MSVCDEGWTEDKFHHEECPALDFMYEGLCATDENKDGRWEPHCKMGVFCSCEHHGDKLPDACPYAPILKLLAEAKEVGPLMIVSDLLDTTPRSSYGKERVTFWIRR